MERRSTDSQITQLIAKVEQLDSDVKKLRTDFDDHSRNEALKVEMLSATLVAIQVKLDQLLIEIKEPLESYKTAKYGMNFVKWVVETAKWAVPLIVGSMIGYGALNMIEMKVSEPVKQEQLHKGQQ